MTVPTPTKTTERESVRLAGANPRKGLIVSAPFVVEMVVAAGLAPTLLARADEVIE